METDLEFGDTKAWEPASWLLAACPMNAAPTAFGEFDKILRMWRDKHGPDGTPPNRKDFDFFEFEGWWGQIAIAEIKHDPFDVRYSLWGTRLTEWWGIDYTNKLLGKASIAPDVWRATERRYFEEMTRAPFIGAVFGRLEIENAPAIQVIGLDLPLSQDGVTSHVLSAFARADTERMLGDIAGDFPISRTFDAL